MANSLSGTATKYVHCPRCDKLNRYFNLHCRTRICYHCGDVSKKSEFKEPEVSDRWIAQRMGHEISIVQMKDLHGRISCGWFSDSKVLIAEAQAHAGSSEVSPVVDQLFRLAEIEAEKRNQA